MVLAKIIKVDSQKCKNCHACITTCPSKLCNDGSGDYIKINDDLCIGCGQCIKSCTWGARMIIDDTENFFNDLNMGVPMVAIVAPAVAASFPSTYLNLNGWLKNRGVSAIFDVSFGAELTIKSYLDHIQNNHPKVVIAQPCPAIVSYIEIYKPELIEYLAPADSPMLHTIKMIKEFYPQYKDHKVAIISPCIAKKREFDETGYGDYNVTMINLKGYLVKKGILLGDYNKVDYDNPPAERAVSFSTPGGLMETAERWTHGIRSKIKRIEGPHVIYKYFNDLATDIENGNAPLIVDCLNCEKGCNGGTGTDCTELTIGQLESLIEKRKEQMQNLYLEDQNIFNISEADKNAIIQKRIQVEIEKKWKQGLYKRSYVNRSNNKLDVQISNESLEKIYHLMNKYTLDDHKNCSACGYGNCKDMAIAIYNGLNRPENCHHYQHKMLAVKNFRLEKLSESLDDSNSILMSIANTIEARDSVTNGHINRVSFLSLMIGERLGLSPDELEILRKGAILHDIGKIGIPDEILNKPGPLTKDEFDVMKTHTKIGEKIISSLKSFENVKTIIRHHHEKLDGSGYPDGLKDSEIDICTRIVAIVDIYDALTDDRPYRKAMSKEQAFNILESDAEKGLIDFTVLKLLMSLLDKY